ncbi:MAG: phosphoribosylglycinamide formyltransferase-1 [Halobacteriales archaeon]|jgi:phosphoribosylglycinamide formyltransferase-1
MLLMLHDERSSMTLFDADRPLRVVVFFSGSASGFRYLANNDDSFGEAYTVVGGFTDDPDCPGVDHLERHDVPVESNDIEAFYAERNADPGDMTVREEFDEHATSLIDRFDADLVLLSGYMWILTEPVLDAYPVLNVHPADLTIEDDDGKRVYVGADPVYDAVRAGENQTRSSVHAVTAHVDAGPVLVRSKPLEVHRPLVESLLEYGADDAFRDYVDAHQEWMKWEGDGPAIAAALQLIAAGRVALKGGRAVIDGEPGPDDLD